ncbi:general odorant-binding protein 45-like [Topomyia yanbarensis]|uniref:general odorant-binding protein 45-like n=1 Tax=Topomyia yanbarensis TaxID=2498891 RepID=UPI00273CE7D2|nr:general odorant-binding protein 45-like [Topomyia yanbarensis]
MNRLSTIFTIVLLVATTANGNHKVVLKSLSQAQNECTQYLSQPSYQQDFCHNRCTLRVLRAWNDSTGIIGLPLARHYHYSKQDYSSIYNRTSSCLECRLRDIPTCEVCKRASVSLDCFRQNYGSALETPQLVPLPKLLQISTILECASILQIAPHELPVYASTQFQFNQQARCLIRCIITRQGLYDDARGPNLDRMYVQCGGYDTPEELFKRDAQRCVDRLRAECLDNCTLAARIAKECFPQNSGPVAAATTLLGSVAQAVSSPGVASIFAGPSYVHIPKTGGIPLHPLVDVSLTIEAD